MPAKGATKEAPVSLPTQISWANTTIVRKGVGVASPPPQWALDSVQLSYDQTMAGTAGAAKEATFESEKQAKAVLHQLRRAAAQLDYGLSAVVEGSKLTFQAKVKKVVTPKAK